MSELWLDTLPLLVLVADDDALTRSLLRAQLERDGFRVIEATNGQEALDRFHEHGPDLILLDQMMPVMDGVTACRHLRALPRGDETPILMLTALDDTATVDAAFAAGATDYVQKPFRWRILRHRLRHLVIERRSATHLRLQQRAMNAARHGIAITDGLANPIVLYHNLAFATLFRSTADALVGQPLATLLTQSGADPMGVAGLMRPDALAEGASVRAFAPRGGEPFWAEVIVSAVRDDQGQLQHAIWNFQDVTERIEQEEERRRALFQEQTLASVIKALNRQVALDEILDLVIEPARALLAADLAAVYLFNPNTRQLDLHRLFGEEAAREVCPRYAPLGEGLHGRAAVAGDAVLLAEGAPGAALRAEAAFPLKVAETLLGVVSFGRAVPGPFDGWAMALVGTLVDQLSIAIERARLYDQLREQSLRDPLTGLYNRRPLESTLTQEFERAARQGHPIAVAMLDLDHFKKINDRHGHAAGDAILREIALACRAEASASDLLYRYGGEELTVVMPESDLDSAAERVEAIRARLRGQVLRWGGEAIPLPTLSVGIAAFPRHGDDWPTVLQAADDALYAAKADGRDRVVMSL